MKVATGLTSARTPQVASTMTAVAAAAVVRGNPRTASGRLPPTGEGASRVRASLTPTETTAEARVDDSQAMAIRAVGAVPPLPLPFPLLPPRPASAFLRLHMEEREEEIRRFETAVVEGLGHYLFHLHQRNEEEYQMLREVGTVALRYLLRT